MVEFRAIQLVASPSRMKAIHGSHELTRSGLQKIKYKSIGCPKKPCVRCGRLKAERIRCTLSGLESNRKYEKRNLCLACLPEGLHVVGCVGKIHQSSVQNWSRCVLCKTEDVKGGMYIKLKSDAFTHQTMCKKCLLEYIYRKTVV